MATWHDDPLLKGRFSMAQHPDDLQVLVHDGGPRLSKNQPELVWATVVGCEQGVYTGRCLNAPHAIRSVGQNGTFKFLVTPKAKHPFQVGEKFLAERASWEITPCNKCGFEALFDAPSDLIRAIFKNVPEDAIMQTFTSFCAFCGGVQVLNFKDDESEAAAHEAASKPWWKFW